MSNSMPESGLALHRAFQAGRMVAPCGLGWAEAAELSFDELSHHPDLLDWLWPADAFAQPDSSAPVLTASEVASLGQLDSVWDAYCRLLVRCGMVIDHHGWLFVMDRQRFDASGWPSGHAFMDRGWARLIRHLELTGFMGYSSSGAPDPGGYLYASGLQDRLCTEVLRLAPSRQDSLLALLRTASS